MTLQKTGKNRDSCDSDSRNQYNPTQYSVISFRRRSPFATPPIYTPGTFPLFFQANCSHPCLCGQPMIRPASLRTTAMTA